MYSGEHGCQAESDSRNCRICSAGWETGETVVLWRKDFVTDVITGDMALCSGDYHHAAHRNHHIFVIILCFTNIIFTILCMSLQWDLLCPVLAKPPFYPSRTWQYLNVFPSAFTSKVESISVWPNPFGPHLIRSFVGFHGSFVQLVQTESMLN